MKLTTIFILVTAALAADSESLRRKADAQRVKEFHAIQARIKAQQAKLAAIVTPWQAECAAKGMALNYDSAGDPACLPVPKPEPEAAKK